jgi:GNAT superfamily N-acetyltransferase
MRAEMKITLRKDLEPDIDFYYEQQFKIYREPYLIWGKEIWEVVLATCNVYRIEVDGKCAGDIILEHKGRGTAYIVDFSLLPEYQGKGIGKAAIEKAKNMAKKLAAVTRKETLNFFLKCGFLLKKRLRNYYDPRVDGYYIMRSSQKGESDPRRVAQKINHHGTALSDRKL